MGVEPLPSGPGCYDASAAATDPILDPLVVCAAAPMRPVAHAEATPPASPTATTPKLWFSPGCPPAVCPACHRKKDGKLTVGQHSRGSGGFVCELPPLEKRSVAKRQRKAATEEKKEADGDAAMVSAGDAAAASAGDGASAAAASTGDGSPALPVAGPGADA